MTSWQPIATAPRDQDVLVWDGEPHIARWVDVTPTAVEGWWTDAGYTVLPSLWAALDPPSAEEGSRLTQYGIALA